MLLLALISLPCITRADVTKKRVEYRYDGRSYVGEYFYDRAKTGRSPGVLIADERGSRSREATNQAVALAGLGYVAFTVDLFGKDVTPTSPGEIAELSGSNAADRKVLRGRAEAGFKALLKQPGIDRKQVVAVGFGVGGTAMIELARTGVDLQGVVDEHGPVTAALPDDATTLEPTFLILTGDKDPGTPAKQLDGFVAEIKKLRSEASVVVAPDEGHSPAAAEQAKWDTRIAAYLADEIPLQPTGRPRAKSVVTPPADVPAHVLVVLKYVDDQGEPMDDYEGGRTFGNFEHRLSAYESSGRRVKYREWDVNPVRDGVNRGAERLITGSDGAAYYTTDHYQHFTKIR